MNLNQNNLVGLDARDWGDVRRIKLPTSLWVNLNNEAIYSEVERDHLTSEKLQKGQITKISFFVIIKINTVINKNSGRFIA